MFSPASGHSQTAAAKLNELADRFVDQQLQYDPTLAYSTGLPTYNHSRFADRRPKALSARDQEETEDLKALLSLPNARLAQRDRATYANLRERLESDLELRVCKTELWNVNHFDGWQSDLAEVAERQPVGSAREREQALQRWRSMPEYVNVEIANLRLGLAQGYSAPKSVVRRAIQQMDTLAVANPEESVFFSPAKRSGDPAFQNAFRQLILHQINPALRSYRDFLQTQYLARARESVAISDLPNGPACYQAFLRSSTTLERSPPRDLQLGAANRARELSGDCEDRRGAVPQHGSVDDCGKDQKQCCRTLSIERRPSCVLTKISSACEGYNGLGNSSPECHNRTLSFSRSQPLKRVRVSGLASKDNPTPTNLRFF